MDVSPIVNTKTTFSYICHSILYLWRQHFEGSHCNVYKDDISVLFYSNVPSAESGPFSLLLRQLNPNRFSDVHLDPSTVL